MRVQGTFELSKKSLLSWDFIHQKEDSSISGEVRQGRKKQDIQRRKAEKTKRKEVAHSRGLDSFWKRIQLIKSQAILPGESLPVENTSYWPGFCSC